MAPGVSPTPLAKKDFTREDFESRGKIFWKIYSVTIAEDEIGSPATLRALTDVLSTFRWARVGQHIQFTKMKSSFMQNLTSGGSRSIRLSDGNVLTSHEDEGDEIDIREARIVIDAFRRKMMSALLIISDLECPPGFIGRERGLIGGGSKCYFLTLDPVQRLFKVLYQYGHGVAPDGRLGPLAPSNSSRTDSWRD